VKRTGSRPGIMIGALLAPDRLGSRTPTVHILNAILTSLLILTSLFLICLILIQRGKGGGLAGAFGGMGGGPGAAPVYGDPSAAA